jgi:two-component system, NarL family, nitrate/nitrite response regulator NarL
MDKPISIVIADDHPILRDGLRKLLEAEDGFVVVGEAASGHEALEGARRLAPDLLLLDLMMPGPPGLDVIRTLTQEAPATRTLVLTANIESDDLVQALQFGARGVVLKEAATQTLLKAIRVVVAGQYWIGPEGVGDLVASLRARSKPTSGRPFGLTTREVEVVRSVTRGWTNKEIAQHLTLSEETVKHHLTKIFSKLNVSNRLELSLFALGQQIVESPKRQPSAT